MEVTKVFHHVSYPAISSSNPSLSASGKVVLVTGGGTGIGKAIAESFIIAGAKAVAITGRSESTLKPTKEELSNGKTAVEYFITDVTDVSAMEVTFSKVVKLFGKIDVVVANAGYLSDPGPIGESDLNEFWMGFEINIKGVVITAQEFLKVASPGATFINITSAAGHIRYIPNFAGYSTTKIASTKVIEYFQQENPEFRIFNVQPGALKTNMQEKGIAKVAADLPAPDQPDLPGDFCVWLAGGDSDFLKGRLVWANWDVVELKEREKEIAEKDLFVVTLDGTQGTSWKA